MSLDVGWLLFAVWVAYLLLEIVKAAKRAANALELLVLLASKRRQ